jgi:predicted outer membrane repeat protein
LATNPTTAREVTSGTINTIAGNGAAGFLGDGDPATVAELNAPSGVTVDSAGNVYIADYSNCAIREISAATGLISTIAGIPKSCGYDGDGPALDRELYLPNRVHLDANGNLFIADVDNQRVRWLSPAGLMTTIAGNGTAGLAGDGGPATRAEFNSPNGIAPDALGDYLIADYYNGRIREVSAFAALNTSANNLDFGLVTVGSTATPQTLTLSALGPLSFSNISISGPFTESDDCGSGLSNAATCTMYVFFKPTAAGAETGAINIEDNGFFTDTTTINLEGTGSAISVTGGPMVFGSEAVGSKSKAKKATVTNKGTTSVTMGAITLDDTDFTISANTCPASGSALAAKAKCTISVEFKPKTNGQKKGALVIDDSDPTSPQIVGMTGTGTSSVSLTPASVDFGDQAVGTTSTPPTKITLTNNTAASLTLKTPAVTVTAPFGLGTGATSCSNGQVIAVGGTCFIYVNFTPTSVGYPTGTVSVFDSDASSPQTVSLSGAGTGVNFNPTSVSLSSTVGRQASTSASITNVGSSTITFTAATISGPNSADWSTNNGDPPCGGSLAPGALCTFTVYFTPSIAGSESATYYVYDSSTGSPQSLPLSGTGVSASGRR